MRFLNEENTSPNSTMIPNVYIDFVIPELTAIEAKVFLFILRRTYGWQKHSDSISISQMTKGIIKRDGTVVCRGVGNVSEGGIRSALKSLENYKLVRTVHNKDARGGDLPTTYILRHPSDFTKVDVTDQIGTYPSPVGVPPSTVSVPPPLYEVETQKKDNNTKVTIYSPVQREELVPSGTVIEPLPITRKPRSAVLGRDTQERERCIEELYRAYREVYDQIPVEVEIHQPAYAKVKCQLTALHTDCKATPDQLRKALKKLLSTKDKQYVTAKVLLENWQALSYSFTAKTPSNPPFRATPLPSPAPIITEIDTAPYTEEERLAIRKSMWEAMWIERIHAAGAGYFPDHLERMAYDASTDAQKAQSRAQGYVEGFCPIFEEYMVEI